MTRILFAAVLAVASVLALTGCGDSSGKNVAPVKVDDATIEAQKKQDAEAEDGEKVWQKKQNKQ